MLIMNESAMNQKSPKSPYSPANSYENEKSRKYDRQLRLWGDIGQNQIELGNVCLINATATGTEILKSLVLSGIGSFTIIDDAIISGEDDNNFFLVTSSIGKKRAKECTSCLIEMNPDVRGDYIEESIEDLLDSNPELFSNFSVVCATNIHNEKTIIKLSKVLWKLNVPLLLCCSIGFFGYIRLQIREHPIVESHPDNALEDLRLDSPFPELKEYLESKCCFEGLSRKEITHIPYIAILYKYLKLWQKSSSKSETSLPSNYKEKNELKSIIKDVIPKIRESFRHNTNEIENELELENFEEALRAINKVLVPSNYIPSETKKIIDDPNVDKVINGKVENTNFWLLARSLKDYINKNGGKLPLRGSIPDMITDSDSYVKLQKLYQAKAKEDLESLYSCLQSICNGIGKSLDLIPEKQVRSLCRNAHCLRLVRTSPIYLEYVNEEEKHAKTWTKLREIINSSDFNGDENNDLVFYLMMRSVNRFYTQYNRYPGYYNDQVESDIVTLKSCFKDLLNELNCTSLSKDDFIHVMCCYGGAELHAVAAFIGGCVAHEVIKLITKQFVPLKSTFIYNAMSSTTVTFDW